MRRTEDTEDTASRLRPPTPGNLDPGPSLRRLRKPHRFLARGNHHRANAPRRSWFNTAVDPEDVVEAAEAVQRAFDAHFLNNLEVDEQTNAVAELEVAQAQTIVTDLILEATTMVFDALDASATFKSAGRDRFWRHRRTSPSVGHFLSPKGTNRFATARAWLVAGPRSICALRALRTLPSILYRPRG
jgi:hypothetical protein